MAKLFRLGNTNNDAYLVSTLFSFLIWRIAPLCLCLNGLILNAQEHLHRQEAFEPHHSVSLILSHTHTAQGNEDGKKTWLVLPSWALDYNYSFSPKWLLGLHTDMVVENFKIKEHETDVEIIERTRPIASVVVISFKPGSHFLFQFGAGGEFAKEGNYFLNRLGVEYALELPQKWELIANIMSDLKWQAYNSFTLGVGISKAFGFRKK